MILDATESSPARLNAAGELLAEGRPIAYRAITIRIADGIAVVCAATQWHQSNLTERIARDELSAARECYQEFVSLHPSFHGLLHHLPTRYYLVDDYRVAAVELCHLDGEAIIWAAGFQRQSDATGNA